MSTEKSGGYGSIVTGYLREEQKMPPPDKAEGAFGLGTRTPAAHPFTLLSPTRENLIHLTFDEIAA